MARKTGKISDIQADPKQFIPIQEDIKRFGYQAVANAGGLSAYQTVMKYFHGQAVNPGSETLILLGIRKLLQPNTASSEIMKDLADLREKSEAL